MDRKTAGLLSRDLGSIAGQVGLAIPPDLGKPPRMEKKPVSDWSASKGLARGILRDRGLRRKAMARSLALLLAVFATGLWVIPGWLDDSIWRFVLWWGGCAFLTVFVLLFALYDALAVIREERDRR